ncbi:FG-GAP repeat domain-containing protein [Dactylosporangium sp. NPDC051541]|uniref:FG-GAP repeat domain-containing protein n=1 Tax=Dactylosporangium sp. NPDC051541 TaxID=3363977 RepID=UPI0037AF9E17
MFAKRLLASAFTLAAVSLFAASPAANASVDALALSPLACDTQTTADAQLATQLNGVLTAKMDGQMNAYHVSCARMVVQAVKARGLPVRAATIALTTTIVESSISNLDGGDDSSVGLFQQINAWGTFAQRTNPTWATNAFLDAMIRKYGDTGWMSGVIGDICQGVQRSDYPERYQPQAADGQRIAEALWNAGSGPRTVVNDFDADGKSDIALFRPSAGQWNIKSAARNVQLYGSYPYGGGDDIQLTGDFDADGYADIALFRKTTGQWNIKSVKRGVQLVASYPYGGGDDTPLTGDFDNDGYTDIALFRHTTGQWNIFSVHRGVQIVASYVYGGGNDVPLAGDFDGDGYSDIALFRKTTGQWNILSLHRGVQIVASYPYGGGDDIPMAGDFDNDGKDDIALFRTTTGQWNIKSVARGVQLFASYQYGGGDDIPLTGDYDGDGYADFALFRVTTGQWNILSPHRGVQLLASHQYGGGNDLPATTIPTGA